MGWEDAPIVEAGQAQQWMTAPIVERVKPRVAKGVWESVQAGWQASVPGLVDRGKLPDIVLDPKESKWYEQVAAMGSQIVNEIPESILGVVGLAAAGTAAGGAVAGPFGAFVGGTAGAGAGAFAVPAAIRESLIQSYSKGEVVNSADFLERAKIVIKQTAKEGAIGAASFLAGAGAARVAGKLIAPSIGTSMSVPAAEAVIGAADVTAQLGTMIVSPAAMEGRLPDPQDFVNAAVLVVGAKAAAKGASKIADIYARTGITPEQVVADARRDPKIAEEIKIAAEKVEAPDAEFVSRDIPQAYKPAANQEMVRNAINDESYPLKVSEVMDNPYGKITLEKEPNHINYRYVEAPEDVQQVHARISEVFQQQIEESRGQESWGRTQDKAQMILESRGIKAEGGDFTNLAAKAMAWQAMEQKAAFDLAEASKTIRAKGLEATPDDFRAQVLAIENLAYLKAIDQGNAAEIARALNARKAAKQTHALSDAASALFAKYGSDPRKLARMIEDIDSAEGMARFASQASKATTWEKVVEAYKAGLIGPISQVANVLGNSIFTVTHNIIDVAAAVRPGGEVRISEPFARMVGQVQGAYEGLKLTADFLGENWYQPMEGLRKLDAAPSVKMEQHRRAIEGDLGVLVRGLSFPWLSAADGAFRLMAERGEANAWAARTAQGEGLNPLTREFRNRVAELAQNLPPEVQAKVTEYGTRATFQDQMGPWGRDLQDLVTRSRVGTLFIPYMQTPANVFKEMARLTPFTAPFVKKWREDFNAGGAARDKALAEIAVGGAILGVTAMLASNGSISGYGPTDPNKRRTWIDAGNQPYSFKVNGTWYDYSRLQPIGTLIGFAADMAELNEYMTDGEKEKVPKMISIAFSQAVTNQVWLKGMVDIARGVAESDRYGEKILQNLAGGMMPASGWLGQTAQLMDDYTREVDGILDAIRNRIPVVREGLQPSIGSFGEPVKNRERLGGVSPIREVTPSEDMVLSEAARLRVGVARAPKELILPAAGDRQLGKVELTPEQRTAFGTIAGKFTYEIMDRLVNSAAWDSMPDMIKERAYERAFEAGRRYAAAKVLPADQRQEEVDRISIEISKRLRSSP